MRWLSLVLTVALLAGCGGESWHTKDIDGLMPDLAFTLTGEGGKTVHGREYRGQVTLVYFGYTYCPDVCPMTLARLSSVLDRLTPAQRDDVSVLFVSVDPRRDSPERLAKYTAAFGKDFAGLTGTQDQLQALTKRYRVTYGYGDGYPDGYYNVSHSSAVFVFDEEGQARLMFRDGDSVDAMVGDLKRLIG